MGSGLREGWEVENFENCINKIVYTKKIQRKYFLNNGEYPIISQEQENINGYWNNHDDLFSVKKPVIIFGDHTQVLKYIDFNFVLGADGVKILEPKDAIESRYFYYYLQSVNLGTLGYARHYRLLKEIEINYPKSLQEQQKIVTILDEAFSAIEKAKANAELNLQNAKELFESYLQGVFENRGEGWEEKTLGEACEILMGQSPKGSTYNAEGIGTPLINGPVEFGKEPFSKTKKTKFTTAPTKYCEKNDLILCVRGSTTGRINISGFKACIGRGVASIRYNENQFWLNYFILASRQRIYDLGTGATFPNVSSIILKNIIIPIPPLQTQQKIVKKLDSLSEQTKKLEQIYTQKLQDLEELKKSILQKAFNGELT